MTTEQAPAPAPATPKHASLRAALNAAAHDVAGLVEKAGRNEEYKYAYVGHEHVLDHVRETLLRNGVVVVPTSLKFVQTIEFKGTRALFLWEQSFNVSHVHSADDFVTTLQITTLPGEQAAAKASTAADRTLLMRLCRLAGSSETADYDRETGEVRDQRRSTQRENAHAEKTVAQLLADLPKMRDRDALGRFYEHARTELGRCCANDGQVGRVRDAFNKRCASMNLDPNKFGGKPS